MIIEKLNSEIRNCKKCELWKTRKFAVTGEGNINAKIMFIGEAPGNDEDLSGIPFVGQAGQIFNELLKHIDLDRREIFIANVLKCRPPKNADPTPEQINCCSAYLEAQIMIIKPRVLCPMGNFATQFIFKSFGLEKELKGITQIKGKVFKAKDSFKKEVIIIPFLHPAVATYNANKLPELKKDIEVLLTLNN
jgi:DNA polymerase